MASIQESVENAPDPARGSISEGVSESAAHDAELLDLYVQTGNKEFVEALIRRHYGFVQAIARRKLTQEQDVQDAVQTTFIVLLQTASRVRNRRSLTAWLYGVVHRTANRIRERYMRTQAQSLEGVEIDDQNDNDSPWESLARKMQLEALDQELHRLVATYREVLVEHYLMGRSTSEIAEQFDVSQSTIEGRLRRGRKELRTRLIRRGYAFSTAIAAMSVTTREASAAIPPDFTVDSLIVDGNTGVPVDESLTTLIAEELKMTAMLTSKFSLGVMATTMAVGVLSFMALRSEGNQDGTGSSSKELTVVAEDADDASGTSSLRYAQAPSPANPSQPAQPAIANAPAAKPLPEWAQQQQNQIRRILRTEVLDIAFHDIPLQQVLVTLSELSPVHFHIDQQEFDLMGIDVDTPVSITLPKDTPFHQVLNYILRPLELDYGIEGKLLVVSSKTYIEQHPALRLYNLELLADTPDEMNTLGQFFVKRFEQSHAAFQEGPWQIEQNGRRLMVAANESTHYEIERALVDLAYQLGRLPRRAANDRNDPFAASGGPSAADDANDPFGAKQPSKKTQNKTRRASSDPFGGNPFGSDNNDPFGGGPLDEGQSDDDPFGSSDPFGSDEQSAASTSNPFGNQPKNPSRSQDPFGGSTTSNNPFGGEEQSAATSSDPFGGQPKNPSRSQDPFGGSTTSSNPFGGSTGSSDPFGG